MDDTFETSTKECPHCCETIKAGAIRCRYCHASLLDTAAQPGTIAADPATTTHSSLLEWFEIADLLSAVVDKSLVQFNSENGRYTLLESVKQYAHELIHHSGEGGRISARHRSFFTNLAEAAEPHLTGPDQVERLDELEAEHDNLRVALRVTDMDEYAFLQAMQLAGCISRFWVIRGYTREGDAFYERVLAQGAALSSSKERAKALKGRAAMRWVMGDYQAAKEYYLESLGIWREHREDVQIARCLGNVGAMELNLGDFAASCRNQFESLSLSRKIGDRDAIARTLGNIGCTYLVIGDLDQSWKYQKESLAISREIGNIDLIAQALENMALVAILRKAPDEALALARESLDLRHALRDFRGIATSLETIGYVACSHQRWRESALMLGAAAKLRREQGSQIEPPQQEFHDRCLAALSVISPIVLAADWASGEQLSLDDIVRLAEGNL